jgi:hypothetical protein
MAGKTKGGVEPMKYRITSELQGFVTSAYLFLEGQAIHMSYDGKQTYTSTDYLEVDDELDVVMRVYGLNGTAWTLKITATRDDSPPYRKEFERTGEIARKQTALLTEQISLK